MRDLIYQIKKLKESIYSIFCENILAQKIPYIYYMNISIIVPSLTAISLKPEAIPLIHLYASAFGTLLEIDKRIREYSLNLNK